MNKPSEIRPYNGPCNRPYNWISVFFWVLFFLLQYKLWFMQDGIITSWRLKSDIITKQQENESLLARNNSLSEEIKAWKTSAAIIEGHARYDLGMLKNGEVFYRIIK